MSKILEEEVFPMPPLSLSLIEGVAEALLQELCPRTLQNPCAVDLRPIVELELPKRGIDIYPASRTELGPREAATNPEIDPSDPQRITILLEEDLWDDFLYGGSKERRARATLAHEIGHAVLHVPIIRRWRSAHYGRFMLNRVARSALKAFEDPEWQAWALAGSFLIPRRTLNMLGPRPVGELAEIYEVSREMMASHLRRLKVQIIY